MPRGRGVAAATLGGDPGHGGHGFRGTVPRKNGNISEVLEQSGIGAAPSALGPASARPPPAPAPKSPAASQATRGKRSDMHHPNQRV